MYSTTCAGYEQAYFNQQCNNDGLYSKNCPNYSVAYARKMLFEQQGIASTVATAGVIAANAPTTTSTSTSVSSDGTVSTSVSKTGDTEVDKAITPQTSTTNSATAPAAPVQLNPQPSGNNQPGGPAGPNQQAERKQEKREEGGGKPNQGGPQDSKQAGDKPKTARQEMQAKREAAAREKAVEEGKNLADNMGKAADMESQKQVQAVVIQAMSFVPGFDVYTNVMMADRPFYKQEQVYKTQKNVDNRNLGRRLFGPSDNLHNEMVESQYDLKSQ